MPQRIDYQTIFIQIKSWIDDGQLKDPFTIEEWNDWGVTDHWILDIFGAPKSDSEKVYFRARDFNEHIRDNKIDLEWLFGPHGLTLLKMKIAQQGVTNE